MEDEVIDYNNFTEADLELKSFKCPRCDKEFKTTNDLFVHMRESYSDPTTCQLCGKNLNCMANILSHSYLHQDIKPYKCPKCKYSTRTRFNLRVHFGSCAKVEKFSYKRGTTNGRKRKSNNNNNQQHINNPNKRRRKTNSSRNNARNNHQETIMVNDDRQIQYQQNNINTMMYNDDLLNQLPDSGPAQIKDRDISCLVQVHIQNFPRPNQINSNSTNVTNNSTDRYYQQQNNNNNTQQPIVTSTDIKQFYNVPPITQQQIIPCTVTDAKS